MDELEKRAQKGLNEFKKNGSLPDVKSSLDNMVDSLFDGAEDVKSSDVNPQEQSRSKKWLIVTAILLSLASIAYIGYKDGSKVKTDKELEHNTPKVLFAQYFEPMDDITSDISRGESKAEIGGNKGMQFYALKKYKQAAKLLLLNEDVDSQFYGALSLLNAGEADGAIPLLKKMQTTEDFKKYHDIIDWYVALAYLSNGDKSAAVKELSNISKKGGYKHSEAKAILDSI